MWKVSSLTKGQWSDCRCAVSVKCQLAGFGGRNFGSLSAKWSVFNPVESFMPVYLSKMVENYAPLYQNVKLIAVISSSWLRILLACSGLVQYHLAGKWHEVILGSCSPIDFNKVDFSLIDSLTPLLGSEHQPPCPETSRSRGIELLWRAARRPDLASKVGFAWNSSLKGARLNFWLC